MRLEWETTRPTGQRWSHANGCQTTARSGNACAEQSGTTADDEHKGWTGKMGSTVATHPIFTLPNELRNE